MRGKRGEGRFAVAFDKAVFARRLEQVRAGRGMSREDLSEASGIGVETIKSWELGRTVPKLDMACRLVDALGVDIGDLIEPFEMPVTKAEVIQFAKAM